MSRRTRVLVPMLAALAALPVPAASAQTPTTTLAEGVLLERRTGHTHVAFDGPRARVRTIFGQPVIAREVVFTAEGSGQEICRAQTDYLGDARCETILVGMLTAAASRRYYATFAGDAEYGPSYGHGALVHFNEIRI